MRKSVRYILNGLTLPVFVVDPDRKISFINKSAKMRYHEAYTGQFFNELITPPLIIVGSNLAAEMIFATRDVVVVLP